MAISQSRKTKILFYFGWSGLTIVTDSTHFNSVVNDRIESASANIDISALVNEILDKLEDIDMKLEKARCRVSTEKIDNITLNKDEIYWLLKERRRCIRELADLLDIPIVRTSGGIVAVIK